MSRFRGYRVVLPITRKNRNIKALNLYFSAVCCCDDSRNVLQSHTPVRGSVWLLNHANGDRPKISSCRLPGVGVIWGKGDGGDRKNTLARSRSCTLTSREPMLSPRALPGDALQRGSFSGNGNLYNARIGIPVVSFLCPKVTIVAMVSFARKNETIESIAATLEQSALHLFLAAEVPASIQAVS